MLEVKLLGTRGSIPVTGSEFSKYGGDTSCVLVQSEKTCIILDAGTGLRNSKPGRHKDVHILLSHAHIDHLLGLPMFYPAFRGAVSARLYARPRDGLGARAQLERLMSLPLWPVGPEVFGEHLSFSDIADDEFEIGDIRVRVAEGNHPGGALVYRLESGGKSLVYCTDFEHGSGHTERVIDFASGCGLLIYDASYSEDEYPRFVGWGHSTWQMGAKIGSAAGAGRVAMFHHSATRTDARLSEIEAAFCAERPDCEFGKEGSVFKL